MNWKSPITRIVLAFLLLGSVGAGALTWREYERGERIQREVDLLRAEAEKIDRENQGLSEKIAYFSSPNFQEQEAKQKLGYRRQDEEVVLVRPEMMAAETEILDHEARKGEQSVNDLVPNYQKWLRLFYQ